LQKPIYLYDSGGVLSATITEVIDSELAERLDGTLTLYFASKVARLPVVTPETLIEFDGQYYRAMQIQSGISGGEFSLSVSCEQESITLVDYAIEEKFAFVGTANDALARLLDGTGITATAEYDGEIAVNVSGGNRRSVLLEIAALCGGEIEYHGHQIRIVNRRGTGAAYIAVLGSNTLETHTATGRVYGNLYKTYTVNPDTGEIVCSDYLSATLTGEVIYNNYKNYPVYKDITGKVHYINSVTKLASGSYRRTSQTITATRRTKELPSEEIHVSDIAVNTDPRSGTVSYDITISDPDKVSVGDDVELNFAPLRLTGSQRIVGKRYNPFNCTAVYLEAGEYSQTITSDYSDMQQIFLRKADAKMEFESYINSAEGIAAVKGALSGEFVTQDALTGFVTESQLNVAVEAYINGEEGIAKLTESLSGTFVTVREYGNNITLTATSQMFVQAEGSDGYSPSSITLTANTDGGLTFAWYKDGTLLSGKTAKTLTVYPADIADSSATYKVVGTATDGKTYSDQMTLAKLREGKEGADGASGYTMVLSNEYIEIPVTEKRFPKTTRTYSCIVSVYSGTTKMTAVTGTPAAGQFRVSTPASVTGITVSQSPAGTVKLTVSTGTAIGDINEISFNVEIYGGVTLPAKITMTANMNDIAAGAYEVTSKIDVVVGEYIENNKGTILAGLAGEFVTQDDLKGLVTKTELNTGIKQYIDGEEGTASIVSAVSGKFMEQTVSFEYSTPSGVNYGFTKTSDGYYTSTNAGVNSSFSYGVFTFTNTSGTAQDIVLRCINSAEKGNDFGIISTINNSLSMSSTTDTSNVLKTFSNTNSTTPVDVVLTVPAGTSTISFKFKKDSSVSNGNDCFKILPVIDYPTASEMSAAIEQKVNALGASLKLSVINGEKTSTIELTKDGVSLSSQTIQFNGEVVFKSDLSKAGDTTFINGANIMTGTLSADMINTTDLRVQKVWYYDASAEEKYFSVMSSEISGASTVTRVGPKDIRNGYLQALELYGSAIYFVPAGKTASHTSSLLFDMEEEEIVPAKDDSWYIGTSNNSFSRIYLDTGVYLRDQDTSKWSRLYTDGDSLYWKNGSGKEYRIV
jgi:hypothetical protein